MKKFALFSIFSILIILFGCSTNPITGRKSMELISNSQLFPSSFQQFNEFLNSAQVVNNTADSRKLDAVGQKLVVAANNWFKDLGQPDYLKDHQWEFRLIRDNQVNAWAMPGGKIAFYTGIMPLFQNDAAIACVMGHEIAHAILDHGKERMNAAYKQQAGGALLSVLFANKSPETQNLIMQAYGIGSTVGLMLPYSRKQEYEADEVGVKLMAMAGYNPQEALNFWTKMTNNKSGQAPPEYMSTHPSDANRIQNLQNLIPKAKEVGAKYGHKF